MARDERIPLHAWLATLDPKALELWHELMDQIRQTHGDVWNGVRFFQTLNAVIVAAMVAIWTQGTDSIAPALTALAAIGIAISAAGIRVLASHRRYYLGVLARKTLFERALGFYDVYVAGIDMVLPWSVPREFADEVAQNPVEWQRRRLFQGEITPILRNAYVLVAVVYVVVGLASLAAMVLATVQVPASSHLGL